MKSLPPKSEGSPETDDPLADAGRADKKAAELVGVGRTTVAAVKASGRLQAELALEHAAKLLEPAEASEAGVELVAGGSAMGVEVGALAAAELGELAVAEVAEREGEVGCEVAVELVERGDERVAGVLVAHAASIRRWLRGSTRKVARGR